MVKVVYVSGNGAETATVELDDFTVKTLYPDIAEMLQGASTDQPCPSPQFKLSRQARQRRSRRSNRIKA
jgi:hypothetical protein